MSTNLPLFQLRKEVNLPLSIADGVNNAPDFTNNSGDGFPSVDISLETHHEDQQTFNNIKILTENEKYVVKRLAPDLSLLPISSSAQGLVDTHSGNALVNDNDYLYIWDYCSSQRNTNFCKIALHEEYAVLKYAPICLFTWPAAMDDTTQLFVENSLGSSGGVCIINRTNSRFIYYEDIDSISNLNQQLSHRNAHSLNLKLKENESVTLALNIEPAGIVMATSWGRVMFVTIRDSSGKPSVQLKQQLIKPQRSIFFHSFNKSKEIASLKMGPIVGRGERLLYIVTRGGNFQTWHLSVGINCFKRVDIKLFDQIVESLQELYPLARSTLQVLDSHPFFSSSSSSHLILSAIMNEDEMYYILTTIVLDEKTGSFTILYTYRLNTYVSPFVGERPKLFVPAAVGDRVTDVTTVFILFSDAVVLTQVSSKLDSSYPLRRKWEDIISFRKDVKLIGSGYNSDSVYVVSKEIGVVEVTITGELESSENIMEEIRFVKSHVDQAVYFAGISSNPIEFNLPKGISLEVQEIETDLRASSDEIFFSKGKYIPPMMSTLTQHLNMRVDLFKNLLHFVEQNFNYKVSPLEKLDLIEKFEIMNCCLKLTHTLVNIPELDELWKKNLKTKYFNLNMETLVIDQLCEFPKVFTQFLIRLSDKTVPLSATLTASIADLLVSCLYGAVLEEGEKNLRYGLLKLDPLELSSELPWFINYENLDSMNSIFFDFDISSSSTSSNEDKERLLTLVKTLYYIFNQANLWFKELPQRQETQLFHDFQNLFLKNHLNWNQALIELNLEEEVLQIAEFYQDLEVLVETLEALERSVSQEIYSYYFEKFGYQFASTLFEYYINRNKLDDLFYRFSEQHDLLVHFFESSEKYGHVAWIQEILDKHYGAASETLCNVSMGDTENVRPLDECQIYLNIAKLAALAVQPVSVVHLRSIQSNLDTVDGQKNLHLKLRDSRIKISPRLVGTQFEKLFQSLTKKIKEHQRLPLQQLIETYSMLEDADSFYCALKLLAFDGDSLGYEPKKFLVAMVWRRCILKDQWISPKDDTKSSLYLVLYKFFNEEIFLSDIALPSYGLITDKSLLTPEYLHNMYHELGAAIKESFTEEIETVELLGPQFDRRIQSILGTANENTGKKCIINYETNTVVLDS